MENINVEKMSTLSEMGACKKNRLYKKTIANSIKPGFKNSPILKRSQIIKDTIKNCLIYNEKDEKNVMTYMNSRYIECGFINPQQKMQVLLDDWRKVMRYLNNEGRFAKLCSGKEVKISNDLNPIMIRPDISFPTGDRIELVYFKIGKPVSLKSKNRDSIEMDLKLYATILYGRFLGFKHITASIYYLRRSDDSSLWNKNKTDFFGDNVIRLIDYYDGEDNDLDEEMKPIVDSYKNGIDEEKINEDRCKYCEFYNLCKYKKAPVSINNEEKIKE